MSASLFALSHSSCIDLILTTNKNKRGSGTGAPGKHSQLSYLSGGIMSARNDDKASMHAWDPKFVQAERLPNGRRKASWDDPSPVASQRASQRAPQRSQRPHARDVLAELRKLDESLDPGRSAFASPSIAGSNSPSNQTATRKKSDASVSTTERMGTGAGD